MRNKIHPSIIVAIITFCALSFNAPPSWADKIYRWVDDEGVTHYSAKQPSDANTDTETLNIKSTKKNPYDSKEDIENAEDSTTPGETAAVENSKTELSPEELAKIKKEEQANCTKARKNLYTLNNRTRIVAPDPDAKDGTQRYLNDDERAQWKAEATKVVEEFCQ